MPYGYHGKVLHIDLTNGGLEIEQPHEEFYRFYMGGSAMGMHYVLQDTPPHANPLGPENTLVLALSVLTGTPISGQSRMTAVAKSPLTDAIGDSQSGGFWPAELKFASFDAIVLRGRVPKPVYLWVHDGQAELRDASHLWGGLTGDVEAALKKKPDDKKIEVLQVGPAGEQGVRSDGFNLTPEELEEAKDTYYSLAGWDVAIGTPTPEKLTDLGLEWLVT